MGNYSIRIHAMVSLAVLSILASGCTAQSPQNIQTSVTQPSPYAQRVPVMAPSPSPPAVTDSFLMAVEDILTIQGRGVIAMGVVERGKLKVGEPVEIVGIKPTKQTIVTGVEMFKKITDEAVAGETVGLLLRGVERQDIERGQVIAKPGSIKPYTKFKATIDMLKKEEAGRTTPLFTGYKPQIYLRTTDVTGVVELPAGIKMVEPGAKSILVTIELIASMALEKGQVFKIREGGRTVGAGQVIEIIN